MSLILHTVKNTLKNLAQNIFLSFIQWFIQITLFSWKKVTPLHGTQPAPNGYSSKSSPPLARSNELWRTELKLNNEGKTPPDDEVKPEWEASSTFLGEVAWEPSQHVCPLPLLKAPNFVHFGNAQLNAQRQKLSCKRWIVDVWNILLD